MAGARDVEIPAGDGAARVTATRGFKNWFSTREAGLTVESTVSVNITCGQSVAAIEAAAEIAGNLAENLAVEGAAQMGLHMDKFAREISSGLGEPPKAGRTPARELDEPPRRSEKTRKFPR